MPAESKNVKHVVTVKSSVWSQCIVCDESVGDAKDPSDTWYKRVNHYLGKHKYRLLHVGTETDRSDEGLWHVTVAVLGK